MASAVDPGRVSPAATAAASARGASHRIGALIGGKYRVRRVLGVGGMGVVYKAVNTNVGRTVALKVLHPHLADDGVALARFQREAQAAAGVDHPNVVEIFDMGMHAGSPFIVMEYVRGHSLQTVLREQGHLPEHDAVSVVGQALAALSAVHGRGVVHRDLKPENVLLSSGPGVWQVKICDFGVAALLEAHESFASERQLTPMGRAMGTPFYTAPEVVRGGSPRDPRVDVYAAGVLLFELLTGERPFQERNVVELCAQILHTPAPPLRVMLPGISEALDAIVQRAMEKDPEARFQTALEMQNALIPFGGPTPNDDPEPTDTFTLDLRELTRRERDQTAGGPALGEGQVASEVVGAILDELRASVPTMVLRQLESSVGTSLLDGEPSTSDSVLALLDAADELAGMERRLVADAGRRLADACHEAGLLPAGVPPELVFASSGELWTRLFVDGEPRVREVGRGYGLLDIANQPFPHLARSVMMVGFLDRALDRAGGRDVEVRLAEAMALGDAQDRLEASWS